MATGDDEYRFITSGTRFMQKCDVLDFTVGDNYVRKIRI